MNTLELKMPVEDARKLLKTWDEMGDACTKPALRDRLRKLLVNTQATQIVITVSGDKPLPQDLVNAATRYVVGGKG